MPILPHSIDEYYATQAESLRDDQLQRELTAAEQVVRLAVRTRKDLAQRRLYCLQCELRRRADIRNQRNPGRA